MSTYEINKLDSVKVAQKFKLLFLSYEEYVEPFDQYFEKTVITVSSF